MPKVANSSRITLLALSWLLLVVSLPLPGLTPLGIPDWALISIAIAGLFGQDGLGPPQLLLVGLGCFLVTTVILLRRVQSALGVSVLAVILSGLMVVWLVPALGGIEDHVGVVKGFSEFRWGYYVYSLSHTLMFISGIIAITSRRTVRDKRGFPVVVSEEKAQPHQAS